MAGPIQDPGHIPGPVFINGVAAIRLFWRLKNGKLAFNVLHGKIEGSPITTQAAVDTLFTNIKGALSDSGLLAALDVETILQKVGYRNMSSDSPGVGYAEIISAGTEMPGTASGGSSLPAQIALVVSLRTAFSGQANRGRCYLGGFNTGAQDLAGRVQGGVADNAVDFLEGVQSALDTAGHQLCIAQPARKAYVGRTGTNHPARDADSVPVTNIVVLNNVWDTQRLRSRI
jgi:hypothetical protein